MPPLSTSSSDMNKLQIPILAVLLLANLCLNAQTEKQSTPALPQEAQQPLQPAQTGDKLDKDDTAEQKEPTWKLPSNAEFKNTLENLTPRSVVLEIDGQTATWRELYPHIQKPVEDLLAGKWYGKPSPVEIIHSTIQKLAARRMFAMEAKILGLLPSDEEKKTLQAEIVNNLKSTPNSKIKTLAQYISSFEMNDPNLLNVSYEDILNIMFLNSKLFADIAITDAELNFYIRYRRAVQQGFAGLNLQRHEAMKNIAKNPKLQTDEGFKEMAKEYSEGVEADWGGELDYNFTREELAEVNELKEFNWKVGEVTPVLENSLAFRIMKILRAIPPKTPDEPEKYRVAQILCGKIGDYEDLSDKEGLRARLTPQKQKAKIDEYTYQMSQRFNVKTPLFPDGLWQKPVPPLPIPSDATKQEPPKSEE